jgi:tetratricopeptide (TPR) repeat protein
MDLTLADQYYLKAVDSYPYCREFVIENLNYALSYDEEHAQALCLLGRIYMYELKEYRAALVCLQKALQSDMQYPDTYKYLSLLKIWLSDYDGALKVIRYGKKVKGMDVSTLLLLESLISECKGELDHAKTILKQAKLYSIDHGLIYRIDQNLARVKKKMKAMKPKKSKRRNRLAVV